VAPLVPGNRSPVAVQTVALMHEIACGSLFPFGCGVVSITRPAGELS
jgi:hypothetical protein